MDEFEKWIEQEIYRNPVTIFRTEALQEALAKYHTIKPKEEPLAVLADRKGIASIEILPPTKTVKTWDIELLRDIPDGDGIERERVFEADTYPAAEQAARQWLNEQPDRNEMKEGA